MRLIYADELKKLFPDNGEGSWTYNATAKGYIDAQPTAYDTDKVVEALEAEKDKHFFGTHDDEREVYCMGIDEAIDIVKKGGA